MGCCYIICWEFKMPFTTKEKKLLQALIQEHGLKKASRIYNAMETQAAEGEAHVNNFGAESKERRKKRLGGKVLTAHSGEDITPASEDETKPAKPLAYGAYDERQMIERLSKTYSDWQGDPSEKLVFVTKDGQLVEFKGDNKNGISVKLADVIRGLARKGSSLNAVSNVFHNHVLGKDFSPEDKTLREALQKYGFAGNFHIYYPEAKRIRTLK